MDIGPQELLIIAVLLLVVFGGKQLPALARNLGKARQELRDAMSDTSADTPKT